MLFRSNQTEMSNMRKACEAVRDEFSNYSAKFNTPAKLNNFSLSMQEIGALAKQISLVETIQRYVDFKSECAAIVGYISSIEYMDLGAAFKEELDQAKTVFRESRDSIMDGVAVDIAAQTRIKRNVWISLMPSGAVRFRRALPSQS